MAAFSDGVFSVALTLLAVDLVAAGLKEFDEGNWSSLWPSLLAVTYTYFAIGTFWVAHHNEVNLLKGVSRELLWLNLLFLLFITLMPFAAALLERQWRQSPAPGLAAFGWRLDDPGFWVVRIPFLAYTANLLLAGLALEGLWLHVRHRRWLLVSIECHSQIGTTVWLNMLMPGAALLVLLAGLVCDASSGAWMIVGVPFFYMTFTLIRAAWIRRTRWRRR